MMATLRISSLSLVHFSSLIFISTFKVYHNFQQNGRAQLIVNVFQQEKGAVHL